MGPLTVSGVCPSECVFFPGRPPTTTTDLLSSSRFLLLLFHRRLTISLFIARPYNNARFLHRGRCLSPSRKERVKRRRSHRNKKKNWTSRGSSVDLIYIIESILLGAVESDWEKHSNERQTQHGKNTRRPHTYAPSESVPLKRNKKQFGRH